MGLDDTNLPGQCDCLGISFISGGHHGGRGQQVSGFTVLTDSPILTNAFSGKTRLLNCISRNRHAECEIYQGLSKN